MLTSMERTSRARLALERRGAVAEGLLAKEISASWQRCLEAGLDPQTVRKTAMLDAPEVCQRRNNSGYAYHLARAEIETLYHQIAGSNFMIAFADAQGVVLDAMSDHAFGSSADGRQLLCGSVWSEVLAGTNAMGTASTIQQPVIVHGAEHFLSCFRSLSCSAAPIRDASGHMVGLLDATSHCESHQLHTLALMQMAAARIENGLFLREMRSHVIFGIHSRVEFLGTISGGMIAVDENGIICAINGHVADLMASLKVAPGTRFEQVFAEPYHAFLARLCLCSEDRLFLRDALDRTYAVVWTNPGNSFLSSCRTHSVPQLASAMRSLPALAEPEAQFVSDDAQVRKTMVLVASAARSSTPILIYGETGSGKEMLARYAHAASGRQGEFVPINCAAIPDELFEGELFGYEAGAFTGARKGGAAGLIAHADGGTLLLDEIGELPMQLQAKLLRFLDDRRVRPVGGRTTRAVDVLILAATNADLTADVAAKRFRADLLYRLDIVQAILPPLRVRGDFSAAVRFMMARIDSRANVTEAAIARLGAHDWPGNFRELRTVLTRALLVAPNAVIDVAQVADLLPADTKSARLTPVSSLREKNAEEVLRVFRDNGGNVSLTAHKLAISRNTVYRYIREAVITL